MNNRVGEKSTSSNGETMTIINYKGANDIDVQFDDGTIIESKGYREFKNGNIKNPNFWKKEVGKKFNKLTIVDYDLNRVNKKRWKCVCDCGNYIYTELYSLKNGETKSCGCYRRDILLSQGKLNSKANKYVFKHDYVIG
ncbi:MAG: hypothetical protein ACRDDY_18805, partial [Clostridium sp.]